MDACRPVFCFWPAERACKWNENGLNGKSERQRLCSTYVAHDDLTHVFALDIGPGQDLLDGHTAQLGRMDFREAAIEGACGENGIILAHLHRKTFVSGEIPGQGSVSGGRDESPSD